MSDHGTFEQDRKSMHELHGIIRHQQRRQKEARDLEKYQETASAPVHILKQAYARIWPRRTERAYMDILKNVTRANLQ